MCATQFLAWSRSTNWPVYVVNPHETKTLYIPHLSKLTIFQPWDRNAQSAFLVSCLILHSILCESFDWVAFLIVKFRY